MGLGRFASIGVVLLFASSSVWGASGTGRGRVPHARNRSPNPTKTPPRMAPGHAARTASHSAGKDSKSVIAAMDGHVFTFVGSYRSRDPLQTMDGQSRKTLIWFKKTGSHLRYVKSVMDLSTLAHFTYTGDVVQRGKALTFTDRKLCYGTSATSKTVHASSVEFIEKTLQGCTPVRNSLTVVLQRRDVLDRHYLVDQGGRMALQRVYYRPVRRVVGTPSALTGTYRLMASGASTIPATPTTTLQIYPTDGRTYRFSILTEGQGSSGGYTYNVGTGQLTCTSQQVTFRFQKVLMNCRSGFDLNVDNAPVYPTGLRIDQGCYSSDQTGTKVYMYRLGKTQSYGIVKDALMLALPHVAQQWVYVKYGAGTNDFPATKGVGAHYGWRVIPHP